MNILLIEPDKLLGKVYQQTLERAGYDVVLSREAQQAVAQADKLTPDAVILELQLPGHSGVEFLYEFRSYAEWQNVPVLLHTFVPEQDLELPLQLKIAAHLYKPSTSLRQLMRAVHEALAVEAK